MVSLLSMSSPLLMRISPVSLVTKLNTPSRLSLRPKAVPPKPILWSPVEPWVNTRKPWFCPSRNKSFASTVSHAMTPPWHHYHIAKLKAISNDFHLLNQGRVNKGTINILRISTLSYTVNKRQNPIAIKTTHINILPLVRAVPVTPIPGTLRKISFTLFAVSVSGELFLITVTIIGVSKLSRSVPVA